MSGEGQMSATIKEVSGKSADSELSAEEGQLAVLENAGHQSVSLGGDVQAKPEKRELGVKPVQTKQQTAFGKLIHVNPRRPTLLNFAPITPEPPKAMPAGVLTSREERASFYVK